MNRAALSTTEAESDLFSEHIGETCIWEKKGKDHFSWSTLLLAKSQGQTAKVLLFTFLTWGWGRKGEGSCEVRASAGPPGTPLPGGRKSMWFLSYRWEAWSTASNTDIQWAAKRNKKANVERENALTPLPLLPHLYERVVSVHMQVNAHAHISPATFHSSQGWSDWCG